MNSFALLFSNEKLALALPHINLIAMVAAGKLGLIMPLIVSALSQPRFTKPQRTVLSILSCLAASAIICLATPGAFTSINWMASLLVLLLISWGLYSKFYKPMGIAPWFERVTTVAAIVPGLLALFGPRATAVFDAATAQADGVNPDETAANVATPMRAVVVEAAASIPSAVVGAVEGAVSAAAEGAASKIFK